MFTEEEKSMLKFALRHVITTLARAQGKGKSPMLQAAYAKEVEVYHQLIAKVEKVK